MDQQYRQYLSAQDILNRVFQNRTGSLRGTTGYYTAQDYVNAVFDKEKNALRVTLEGAMLPAVKSFDELPPSAEEGAVCPVIPEDGSIGFYQWNGKEWFLLATSGSTTGEFGGITANAETAKDDTPSVEVKETTQDEVKFLNFTFRIPRGPQGETGLQGETGAEGPAGPKGETGDPGKDGQDVKIGTVSAEVTTLDNDNGDTSPKAEVKIEDSEGENNTKNLTFKFQIPKGEKGATGEKGADGATGPAGERGEKGDPGKDIVIGNVTATVETVENLEDGSAGSAEVEVVQSPKEGEENKKDLTFTFKIPKGEKGEQGPVGPAGKDGEAGTPGKDGKIGDVTAEVVDFTGEDEDQEKASVTVTATDKTDFETENTNVKDIKFSFKIPKGEQGPQGQPGPQGEAGVAGPKGDQGPAGKDAKIGTVSAKVEEFGEEDEQAKAIVTVSGTDAESNGDNTNTKNLEFTFKIPKGPKGDKGDTGAEGAKGETGPTGPQGLQGPAGKIGTIDVQVEVQEGESETDASGSAVVTNEDESAEDGTQNLKFTFRLPKGPKGETGPRGETGPAGEKGNDGTPGIRGERGEAGPAGKDGKIGKVTASIQMIDNGSDPQATATVDVSTTDTAESEEGTQNLAFNFKIPKGEKGETGQTGEQGPKGADGKIGSVTASAEIVENTEDPQANVEVTESEVEGENTKNLQFKFKLPKGEKGETGLQGTTGPQGPQGPAGKIGEIEVTVTTLESEVEGSATAAASVEEVDGGEEGKQNLKFTFNLPKGPKGEDGAQGPVGPEGPAGKQGDPGKDGTNGEPGPKGDAGAPGKDAKFGDITASLTIEEIEDGTPTVNVSTTDETPAEDGTNTKNVTFEFKFPKGITIPLMFTRPEYDNALHLEVKYKEITSPEEYTAEALESETTDENGYTKLVNTSENGDKENVYAFGGNEKWYKCPDTGFGGNFSGYPVVVDLGKIKNFDKSKLYYIRYRWVDPSTTEGGEKKEDGSSNVSDWYAMVYPVATEAPILSGGTFDGTIQFDNLTDDQKAQLKGDQGPAGPAGKDGAPGTKGEDGKDGKDAEFGKVTAKVEKSENGEVSVSVSEPTDSESQSNETKNVKDVEFTFKFPKLSSPPLLFTCPESENGLHLEVTYRELNGESTYQKLVKTSDNGGRSKVKGNFGGEEWMECPETGFGSNFAGWPVMVDLASIDGIDVSKVYSIRYRWIAKASVGDVEPASEDGKESTEVPSDWYAMVYPAATEAPVGSNPSVRLPEMGDLKEDSVLFFTGGKYTAITLKDLKSKLDEVKNTSDSSV